MKREISDFRLLVETTIDAYTKCRSAEHEQRFAHQNFTGARLSEELEKINDEIQIQRSRSARMLGELRDGILDGIAAKREKLVVQGEANKLNTDKLGDFAFLELPVILEKAELEELYNRNWANPVFVRGLEGYLTKHNLPFQFKDPLTSAQTKIGNVFKHFERYTTDPLLMDSMIANPTFFTSWEEELSATLGAVEEL